MEKTHPCCWERTDWGEVLPGCPGHWELSVLMPQSESASLCKWKKCPSLWRDISVTLGSFKTISENRMHKASLWPGAASPGSSQEVKGFLQIIIQNSSSSEFFLTILPHWLAWVSGETLLYNLPSSQLPSSFFSFVTAKLVSLISFWFAGFSILTAMKQPLTFFIKCQKQKCIYSSIEKQNAVAEHPPGCTSPRPYPPFTTHNRIENAK